MIIKEKTPFDKNFSGVKVVVDIEKEILAAYCELHIDCADELVEAGSEDKNLWGANVYSDGKIEFTSMINVRFPKNQSTEIQDAEVRNKVEAVIKKLLII